MNIVTQKMEEILAPPATNVDGNCIQAALELNRQEKKESLTKAVASLFSYADKEIEKCVVLLRNLREHEKEVKAELKALVAAIEYAKQTGNVLPLTGKCYSHVLQILKILGLEGTVIDNEAYKVPEDFSTKE